MLYIYSKKKLNFKLFIVNNNEIIWNLKSRIDIYDIFCLIFICKKFNKTYKSVFTNEDLDTFDFEYHHYNKEVYDYYIRILYNDICGINDNKTIFIKVKYKFEAYIIYILSKIFNYKYKIEKTFKDKELIKSNFFIKRLFYPKLIQLDINKKC
jgi:hypothetical protein